MKGKRGGTIHNRFGKMCKLSRDEREDYWEITLETYVKRN